MKRKQHLPFISAARGAGILLVVIGHAIVPQMRENSTPASAAYDFIYSFHMALFAMFSGYLFQISLEKYRQRGFRAFALSKLGQLMIPYLAYSVLSYAGVAAALSFPASERLLSSAGYGQRPLPDILFQILTGQNHIDRHIWFIYSLFLVFIASYPLADFLRSRAGLVAQAVLFVATRFFPNPEIISRAFFLLLFFSFARRTDWIDTLLQKRFVFPIFLCFSCLFALSAWGASDFGEIFVILLSAPTALAGALATLGLCSLLPENGSAARTLAALGAYSYAIYLIHQPFIVSGTAGALFLMTSLPIPAICAFATILGIGVPILATRLIIGRFRPLRGLFLGDFSK